MIDDLVQRLRRAGCVFAEEEAELLAAQAASTSDLERMAVAREAGDPLEHILGWVQFCGRRYALGPGVFVPRPRSEFLVESAVALLPRGGVLLDLCSGCGAVGLAVGARVPARVHLAELDPVAARWARVNAGADSTVPETSVHETSVHETSVHEGDLFDPVPADLRGTVDIITVVAPYVPTDEISFLPHEARDHEPTRALDGGDDGLDVLRRIATEASGWLAPGGSLLAEVGSRQGAGALVILRGAGLSARLETGADGETVAVGTFDPTAPPRPVRPASPPG